MFERILVALDTSENNTSVFKTALSLAKWAEARLLLAHVLPCPDMNGAERSLAALTANSTPSARAVAGTQQACETQGLQMLREFHALATAAGIGSDLAQPLANPGHQICELAIGWGADLIVIGRRGLTEADEALYGSVSQYVTHHASCPVLIVQHQLLGHLGMYTERTASQAAIVR